MTISDVQSLIEDHLKQLVIKHFDPKMADTIFKDESGVSGCRAHHSVHFCSPLHSFRHPTG